MPDQYAQEFGPETTRHWSKDPEFNQLFLQNMEHTLNQELQNRGHLFLNEVYDGLGLNHTPVGAVVGWSFSGQGDGRVQFEIDEYVDGGFMIDFNVDGFILDKLHPKKS